VSSGVPGSIYPAAPYTTDRQVPRNVLVQNVTAPVSGAILLEDGVTPLLLEDDMTIFLIE
jgi:hypothetical protein